MATTTALAERIESGLRSLLAEVADLPNTAQEWDGLPVWNQASIALDWSHRMADALTELERYYRSGAMTPEQQAHYRALRGQLRQALPLITRLDFYRPPVPLGE